jgi:hypothetical protein
MLLTILTCRVSHTTFTMAAEDNVVEHLVAPEDFQTL